jgi:outer membrane protein OmpA-like peptidoglycan-associated protein
LLIARYAFTPRCGNGGRPCGSHAASDVAGDPDGDGVTGASDLCPFQAEDDDSFEDQDGCPDRDDDGDGLPDASDQCPRYSEDRDGFEDDDGCPEPDNDNDGIADGADACAMDPEDRDGFEDDDGCPEPGPSAATFSVGQERILVSERIYFDYEQDTIRTVSVPVLDGLADVIKGLRAGTKVLVEGHTDDSGNAAYDLDLSYRRARAVVAYLRGRGVAAESIDFVGRGATQPLAPGRSAEARALNRRVEFKLVR